MNTEAKFKALIGLAKADGEFDMHEKLFISYLAEKQGLTVKDLKSQLKNSNQMSELIKDLTYDEKIDILIYLVKLMKADGKVVMSEINYCEKVAKSFGFTTQSIGFLSGSLNDNPRIDPNFELIKRGMEKYQIQAA